MSQIPSPPPNIPQPPTLVYATPAGPGAMRARLPEIAKHQRGVMLCILWYLALIVASLAVPAGGKRLISIALLVVVILSAVYVFMLAVTIYGSGMGMLLGALTLIPLAGLVALLIINAKATGILRQFGVHVGLMGANVKPRWPSRNDQQNSTDQ